MSGLHGGGFVSGTEDSSLRWEAFGTLKSHEPGAELAVIGNRPNPA